MAVVALDGRCLKANRSLCTLLGYTEEELRRLRFPDFTHPDDLERDLQWIAELLRGKRDSYQLEKRYLHKNGSVVWALLSVSLVRQRGGKPEYFVSQILDITARKNAEKKAAQTLREKEDLIIELLQSAAEIRRLQEHLITVCAWTKRIQYDGEWLSPEDFLSRYLRLRFTHGISDEGISEFLRGQNESPRR